MYYVDSEGDQVCLSGDEDLQEAQKYKDQKGINALKITLSKKPDRKLSFDVADPFEAYK